MHGNAASSGVVCHWVVASPLLHALALWAAGRAPVERTVQKMKQAHLLELIACIKLVDAKGAIDKQAGHAGGHGGW